MWVKWRDRNNIPHRVIISDAIVKYFIDIENKKLKKEKLYNLVMLGNHLMPTPEDFATADFECFKHIIKKFVKEEMGKDEFYDYEIYQIIISDWAKNMYEGVGLWLRLRGEERDFEPIM